MAEISDVFFVDGVRTPFGRAGEKGMYWNTRADDLAVEGDHRPPGAQPRACRRSASTTSPIAATSQTGDQGLDARPHRRASWQGSRRRCPASPSTACARAP